MRSEQAGGGVAYSVVVSPAVGEGAGVKFNVATVAATVAPTDFAEASPGAYTDTIELALRHATSGQALASASLRLRFRADPSRAR